MCRPNLDWPRLKEMSVPDCCIFAAPMLLRANPLPPTEHVSPRSRCKAVLEPRLFRYAPFAPRLRGGTGQAAPVAFLIDVRFALPFVLGNV